MQFFRPTKNVSKAEQPNDIAKHYAVPADVNSLLEKACNDCHSNNTKYPWYAEVQPFAWWLYDHVQEGKHELNFNEFKSYRLRKQYHKMEEVVEQVKEGYMPINEYTWAHGDAKLSLEERQKITGWASAIMDTMKARYPIDSLISKK
jgi:hypothetical protein